MEEPTDRCSNEGAAGLTESRTYGKGIRSYVDIQVDWYTNYDNSGSSAPWMFTSGSPVADPYLAHTAVVDLLLNCRLLGGDKGSLTRRRKEMDKGKS